VRYSIVDVSNSTTLPFTVDEKTGWVLTTGEVDRERDAAFRFSVLAEDNGKPPLSSTVAVTVEVVDVNDNDPIFEQREYTFRVTELVQLGSTVGRVKASDRDEDAQIRYELVGGNTRNRFTVSTQNGEGVITVAQPLSFEEETEYLITVNAVDQGGRFTTCQVAIQVNIGGTNQVRHAMHLPHREEHYSDRA
jgi:cadherin EGF LAG seven-pass G-type receptor 1